MVITFDSSLRQQLPEMMLGLVEAGQLRAQLHDPALWTMLEELSEYVRVEFKGKVAADRPEIAATRRAYRALGDDPTRYRPANEALLRRVLSLRALPQINTLVDINTYVSLSSGFAIGCYDAAQISGEIVARRGYPGEHYAPIGKPAVDAAQRLVVADHLGIFGSPTADSQRTMVTPTTEHVLFAIFGFETSHTAINRAVEQVAELLACFCDATILDRQVQIAQAVNQAER
jgi:DNA/RNA-binding domain of Phe-tRNA-synthetase-like protein